VVRAIAGKGARFNAKRDSNSAAICCASAALPPLPMINNFLPPRRARPMVSAAVCTAL